MSYNVFADQLRYITKVTEMLDAMGEAVSDEHHYIKVELVQAETHLVVGKWCEEIGPGSWSFEFVEPTP